MTGLWVAICGGLGCAARYGVGVASERWLSDRLPWATLIVNVLGSFAIGLAFAIFLARGEVDSRARVAITTGFLGGFTTYSAFAFDSFLLLERKSALLFAIYIAAMLALALGACVLGVWAGRAIAS